MFPQRTPKGAASNETERLSSEPASLASLQLSKNDTLIQEMPVDLPRLLVGRSPDNDISIPSQYVSRHHALLIRHGGSVILIDLNSTNGTFVNSRRVFEHVLANGDEITVDSHSPFMQYSIRYCSTFEASADALDDIEPADVIIKRALAEIGDALEGSDTDLLPALKENVPTEVGFIDDR
jgi:hypothetical protein